MDRTDAPTRIVVAGYGKVGRDMVGYLQTVPELVVVAGIVEPSLEDHKIPTLPVYKTVTTGIELLDPDLIIDCAKIGEGAKNLEVYKSRGVPAIIQGGEKQGAAPLYIPGKTRGKTTVRIPKCSATISNSVLLGLFASNIIPKYLEGAFYKTMPIVNEGKGWFEPKYKSAKEIEQTFKTLTGSTLHIGRISSRYLPGEPHGKPIYSADLLILVPSSVTEKIVTDALIQSRVVGVVSSLELGNMPKLTTKIQPLKLENGYEVSLTYEDTPLIPVVDGDSVHKIYGTDIVKLHVEAVAPSIDLPLNLIAAMEMTGKIDTMGINNF